MLEICKWYETNIKFGSAELTCAITDEEASCCGDASRCECEVLRQKELHAEAVDLRADADREDGYYDA